MIQKFRFGTPFETDAVVNKQPEAAGAPKHFSVDNPEDGKTVFTMTLPSTAPVYGMGESVRGINKRGFTYVAHNDDNPHHTETTRSLYGAHNFFVTNDGTPFGVFVDFPGRVEFDLGDREPDTLQITVFTDTFGLDFYEIEGTDYKDIVTQFRAMVGQSYIPPKWAFGYQQCRWSYMSQEEVLEVAEKTREAGAPLDAIYLDIDYMDHYKDFTVNPETFADLPGLTAQLKEMGIRLVPIIDAGVKKETGYDIDDEGVEKGYYVKNAQGQAFTGAVWPGEAHFPDVLRPEVREWFGDKYKILLDQGVEGFWNDMNEPALFHGEESWKRMEQARKAYEETPDYDHLWKLRDSFGMSNQEIDYKAMYHEVDGKRIPHDKVHNLYGYNITRAAGEAFQRRYPDKRILLFSRSSYVGMHRYGGIWQGDNNSWWSHILLNMQMMPGLHMCGFLYTGADIGGFGQDTTEELLLRWMELGVFTPLMRNHSAIGSRRQEIYRQKYAPDLANIIRVRYMLLPYLYSEFVKAALNNTMMIRPLAFDFTDDPIACDVQDQLLIGDEMMIAPIYTPNARGRAVYLPEDMQLYRFRSPEDYDVESLPKGTHYVPCALNEVLLFLRSNAIVPVAQAADCVSHTDYSKLSLLANITDRGSYTLYDDDGFTRDYTNPAHYSQITVTADGAITATGEKKFTLA